MRISDGYQPHLVSPEAGLRKLVHESIELVLDPVSTAVRRVHQVLLEAARYVLLQHALQRFNILQIMGPQSFSEQLMAPRPQAKPGCVEVYWLQIASREASRKASLLLDSTVIDETRTPLKLPQFEMAVMVAATKALEQWRDEGLEGNHHSAALSHFP